MAGPTVSSIPKGLALGRFIKSLAIAQGDVMAARAYAMSQAWNDTPQVLVSLKSAVDALSTVNEPGGASLALSTHPIAVDFAALLRPATILGRLVGLHSVPFNCRMLVTATGISAHWRGEGAGVAVSKADLDTSTLAFARLDSMCVITQELTRHSSPAVESILAADMVKAAAAAADTAFLDPENSGSANVRPASITSGISAIHSGGNTVALIDADLRSAIDAVGDSDLSTAAWCMRPRTATYLATLRGSGGAPAYPQMTARGGTLLGLPVLTSTAIQDSNSPSESYIALVVASEIAMADDGDSQIEFSNQASLQLDDAPAAGAANVVSLWQHNLVGMRASRAINWARRRSTAAAVIDAVQF